MNIKTVIEFRLLYHLNRGSNSIIASLFSSQLMTEKLNKAQVWTMVLSENCEPQVSQTHVAREGCNVIYIP